MSFSPERGVGLGEMVYDTNSDGVTKASIRERQTLKIGKDLIPCVIVDVEYGTGIRLAKFSFWIGVEKALVLRRAVTFWDGNGIKTLVSSILAITINEPIPEGVFEFEPPPGAREVPAVPPGKKA